jgi:hypothetical protein
VIRITITAAAFEAIAGDSSLILREYSNDGAYR